VACQKTPLKDSCDLFLFAGEPSADLHGEKLLKALYAQKKDLKVIGVGGPKMRAVGMDILLPMEEFQVMGFIDVLLCFPSLLKKFFFVKRSILSLNPKAVVTIDYPGFNLRMAKALRKSRFPGKLIHYICPSVWAWGKGRIDLMAKYLDLLLTIFPFEKQYFSHTRLNVEYVGNPLIKTIEEYPYKNDLRTKFNIPQDKPLIALFPGSRDKVIARNLPLQLQTARSLLKTHPDHLIAISGTPSLLPNEPDLFFIPREYTYELMREASFSLATSGTVTLELALHRTPTVVTYSLTPTDYFLAKHLFRINLPYYCIVNIILQRQLFPECIGPHLTCDQLVKASEKLMSEREACLAGCEEVRAVLGKEDASRRAAHLICGLL
jgi:lipid-A-disaccharide synthase